VRTTIYMFSESNEPSDVAIDSSGNYIIAEYNTKILSKITPTGERTVINTFPEAGSHPNVMVIDSSGNYIVTDSGANVLSKITPAGERNVIYTFPTDTGPIYVLISTTKALELFFTDITENGLTVTWTQSTDPFFTGYQVYQSTTQGELGSLIGTNTDIADTSLTVTGLSPGTTYYFTLRVFGVNGAYVDSG